MYGYILNIVTVTLLLVQYQDGVLARAPPPGVGSMYENRTDKTMDQIIMDTLGGPDVAMNIMMEESGNILAELDMYLSMEQFNKMYEPPKPEDMVEMGLMPAPLGTAKDDPRYSADVPPDFKAQNYRAKRKVSLTANPWTKGEVPYLFAKGHFSNAEEYMMRRAMTEWERYTCLNFRPANKSDPNSLRFQNGQGCNSQLGMRGGVQVLNLQAPGCRFKGLYLHEIGHALGLVHEHQLPDRDNYIRILYHNVSPHMRIWFNKYADNELTRMKVPYELSSVMHYGITAFSKDGESQTIEALDREAESRIGRVYLKELSYTDVEMVNKFYECASHCPLSDQEKCGSDGHLDQNCNCVCRDGSQDCDRTKQRTDRSCKNDYYDWECSIWANQGECEKNPTYMKRDCAKACGVCGSKQDQGKCEDKYAKAKCQMWKDRGDCVTNTDWMKRHCAATCKLCDGIGTRPEENCQDAMTDKMKCFLFAKGGECIVNRHWMFENCRKSCHMCADTDAGTTDETDDGFDEDDMTCDNKHVNCEKWASIGECTANPGWMTANCRKACDKCDDNTCKNLYVDVRCEIWAQKMECMANSKWMGKHCAKACGTGPCVDKTASTTARPSVRTTPRTKGGTSTTTDSACVNKHDSDTQCDVWAKAGHCGINPSWMLNNCKKSCAIHENSGACGGRETQTKPPVTPDSRGGSDECDDKDHLCGVWAKNGYCDGNSAIYMLSNCKKSCNNCNGCRDAEFLCSLWAKADHCMQNPRYMMRHCQKSCKVCTMSRDMIVDKPDGRNSSSVSSVSSFVWIAFLHCMILLFQRK